MTPEPIDASPKTVREIFSNLLETGAPICVVAREYIETALAEMIERVVAEETIAQLRRKLETK